MNKLTKSELIEKLEMAKVDSRDYDNGLTVAINYLSNTEILPDPVPEVDERERIMNKYPVDSYVKQINNGAIYQVEYYGKDLVNLKDEDSLSTILISELDLNFEPYEVDTELEEAKKRFPVGSWFRNSSQGSTIHKVDKIVRRCGQLFIEDDSSFNRFILNNCTPATLPTAKWRCMKTDVENSLEGRLVYLGIGHCVNYHIGFYDVAKDRWCVNNQYIDLSCYETFEWLEIPRGE